MRVPWLLLASSVAALLSTAAAAQDAALEFRVTGLTTDQGQVICTLYGDQESWLSSDTNLGTATAKPADGGATCLFPSIPTGTYAVFFMHDLNDNGDMDKNLLGIPKEPWGFSRDAPVRLGPPPFSAAAFEHPSTEVQSATVK